MPSRKPLQTLSNNVGASISKALAVRARKPAAALKKVVARRRKIAKRTSRRANPGPSLSNTTPSVGISDQQYTLKPKIAETFIPLQHRFPAHHAKPRLSGAPATAYDFVHEFWDEEVFSLSVKNPNEYAARKQGPEPLPGHLFLRPWKPVAIEEMKKFVAQVVFIGVHCCWSLAEFWRRQDHIGRPGKKKDWLSLQQFQQIKRYLHVEPVRIERRTDSDWCRKIEPLHSILQPRFQRALMPGSNISLDEMMVRFGGRSKHTYRMPSKPISEGYRILALFWEGYTWNWLYTSRVSGIQLPNASEHSSHSSIHLTPTSIAIYQIAQSLT